MTDLVPAAVLDNHVAILGKTGSGKSNLAKVLVEGLLDRGERVCVIDPTGTWYGLRLERDRTPSPYPVVMFGGDHADIAIAAGHGAAVAEAVGTTATPAVIDTLAMSVGGRTGFFTAFAETLLQRNRGPLHLVIDEAHLFAPQGRVNDPRSGQMVHAANNLVSLGRGRGLRITLITQRPAKLHKDSLTQVETLIALRLIAPQDVSAVDDWIGEAADRRQGAELRASLPGLRTGEAWVWSPQAGFLERMQMPLARTLDTGKPSDEPVELAPIDVDAVRALLDGAAEPAGADDPKVLRARIADLQRQLKDRPAAEPRAFLEPGEYEALSRRLEDLMDLGDRIIKAADSLGMVLDGLGDRRDERLAEEPREAADRRAEVVGRFGAVLEQVAPSVTRPRAPATVPTAAPSGLKPGAQRILGVLARHHPLWLTMGQLGALSDYTVSGGSFQAQWSALRAAGLVVLDEGEPRITDAGLEAAGVTEPAPATNAELQAMWKARLHPRAAAIVDLLIGARAAGAPGLTRIDIADRIGMTASGGAFQSYLSTLRRNGLAEGDGDLLRAGDALYIGGRT